MPIDITIPPLPSKPLVLPPLTLANMADPSNAGRLVANPVPVERLAAGDIIAVQGRAYTVVEVRDYPTRTTGGRQYVAIHFRDTTTPHEKSPYWSLPRSFLVNRITRGTEGEPVVLTVVNPEEG